MLGADELPRRHRVVVHVDDTEITVEEASELLPRQNKDMASHEWVTVRGSESKNAMSAHCAALIGDWPLEALKTLNFKPYCGLGRATVKLPTKAHKESKDEKRDAGSVT